MKNSERNLNVSNYTICTPSNSNSSYSSSSPSSSDIMSHPAQEELIMSPMDGSATRVPLSLSIFMFPLKHK